jgi:hypothetical protein
MTTSLLDGVTRLQAALDSLARALAAGDGQAVLAAEEPIASAVTALASFPSPAAQSVPGLPSAIAAVRAAVHRCQVLGEAASQFSQAVLGEATYGRRGLQLVRAPRGVASVT